MILLRIVISDFTMGCHIRFYYGLLQQILLRIATTVKLLGELFPSGNLLIQRFLR